MIIEMNLFKVAQGGESVREFREGNGSPRRQNRTVRTFKFLLENTFAVTFRRVFVCFINRFENDFRFECDELINEQVATSIARARRPHRPGQ